MNRIYCAGFLNFGGIRKLSTETGDINWNIYELLEVVEGHLVSIVSMNMDRNIDEIWPSMVNTRWLI